MGSNMADLQAVDSLVEEEEEVILKYVEGHDTTTPHTRAAGLGSACSRQLLGLQIQDVSCNAS